jgi:hypothetical protein
MLVRQVIGSFQLYLDQKFSYKQQLVTTLWPRVFKVEDNAAVESKCKDQFPVYYQ